jgi:hypothetical protein
MCNLYLFVLMYTTFRPQEESLAAKYRRVMEQKVVVRMEGLRELQVLLPTRQTTTLHTLLGGPQRYLVAVSTELRRGGRRRIEVRSPLRLRNDTAFALAILYRKSVLDALGAAHVGESTNPFEVSTTNQYLLQHGNVVVRRTQCAWHCWHRTRR